MTSRWRALVAIWLTVISGGFLWAPDTTADQPQLSFASPAKLEISADSPQKQSVFVDNASSLDVSVSFRIAATTGGAPAIIPLTSVEIQSFKVRRVELEFKPSVKGKVITGELEASAPKVAPATIAIATTSSSTPSWVYLIVLGSLAFAAVFMSVRWFSLKAKDHKIALKTQIGPGNWEFSKSWGSTLTVAASLLGTVVAAGVLPEGPTKSIYTGLNLAFGAAVLIAPFLYTAIQKEVLVTRPKAIGKDQEPQFQGYVGSFLLATTITLWAVIGELATLVKLATEVFDSHSIPTIAVVLLLIFIVVALASLLFVTWRRSKAILIDQADKTQQRKRQRDRQLELIAPMTASMDRQTMVHLDHAVAEIDDPDQLDSIEPALPTWPLL